MKYYKYDFQVDVDDNRTIYIETKDGWTLRQLELGGEQYVASNVRHPDHGPILCDQKVDYEEFDDVIPISKAEFENVWGKHLGHHALRWAEVKRNYPVGADISGVLYIFYPQGVLVDLDINALGVADYAACVSSAPPGWIPGTMHKITARVSGYDESNQWVVLTEPHVHLELSPVSGYDVRNEWPEFSQPQPQLEQPNAENNSIDNLRNQT